MNKVHRVITWSLLFLLCGMTYLLKEVGDTHAVVTDMNNIEIASLHLKIAELEGELLKPPETIEMAVDTKTGDAVVRVEGQYLYAFPGICHSPPGYDGNL